ncbi:MAG: DUF1501 domain-containing protein, partial [Planctomycetota bacterium]
MNDRNLTTTTRRSFLRTSAGALSAAGLATSALAEERAPKIEGQAEHCIMLWLGGGACQIDTFDPKKRGDAKARKPGSYYDAIPTAVDGVSLCEHLPRTAAILERVALLRTVHHDVIDEHGAAVNRM